MVTVCPSQFATRRSFFFQAEDGIRDLYVTGVQTCALPICRVHRLEDLEDPAREGDVSLRLRPAQRPEGTLPGRLARAAAQPRSTSEKRPKRAFRSEERRVGKECRARGQRRRDNRE